MQTLYTRHQIQCLGIQSVFNFYSKNNVPFKLRRAISDKSETEEIKTLIILHGWGGNAFKYRKIIPLLQTTLPHYQIIAVDQPGFGDSSYPPQDGWTPQEYAKWLNTFLDQLHEKSFLNKNQTDLYGHSFGGRVTANFLSQNPDFPGRAILVGASGIKLPKNFIIRTRILFSKIGKPFAQVLPKKIQIWIKHKIFKAHDYVDTHPEMMTTLLKNWADPCVSSILPNIKHPVQLIWGDQDTVTPLAGGHIYHDRLPHSQLDIIHGAKHGPHHTHPKEIAKIINDFLEYK